MKKILLAITIFLFSASSIKLFAQEDEIEQVQKEWGQG